MHLLNFLSPLLLLCALPLQAEPTIITPTPTDQRSQQDSAIVADLIKEEDKGSTDNLYNLLRDGASLSPFRKTLQLPVNYTLDCSDLTFPVIGKVLSPFGYRRKRQHSGTDIKLLEGDTVVTARTGIVIFARYYGGYGNLVVVRHDREFETFYSHLSAMLVKEGQVVNKGESIGLGGRTGRATGTHLHFEVRIAGRALDSELIFDFPNKKIRATQYIFNSNGKGKLTASNDLYYYPTVQLNSPASTPLAAAPNAATPSAQPTHPAAAPTPTAAPTTPKASKTKRHTVRQGDTLYSIARRYGTTVNQLRRHNSLPSNVIHPGKKLLIP